MPADTPQPGKTPHGESDPWSFADPGATWWRGQTDRDVPPRGPGGPPPDPGGPPPEPGGPPPEPGGPPRGPGGEKAAAVLLPPAEIPRTGEGGRAHDAGVQDAADELRPAVERDHDQPDAFRYQPPPTTGKSTPPPTAVKSTPPAEDVMVLPEPSVHHRPTVPLDHPMAHRARPSVVPQVRPEPVPQVRPTEPVAQVRPTEPITQVRPTEPLPPPTGMPATDARLQRLENSPFWRDPVDDTIEVPPGEEPAPVLTRARHRGQGRATRKQSGRPLSAQASLVALGLVAAFFAWVSAEPFWLAAGHGDHGYATTTICTGDGVTQRCAGRFISADGRYTMTQVRLVGVEGPARQPGSITPARMVSPDSRQAYLGGTEPLLHLRWLLGFALVLLCGYAIAGVTKARQLETARARRAAVLLSLAGPLALLSGFLAAAY